MTSKRLDPEFLINAYASGYFPMPHPETEEIMWFDPDPRCIIPFDNFYVSKSLKRRLNKKDYQIKLNSDFEAVMRLCADREDTWINEEFIRAYGILNEVGFAHSLEVWIGPSLVGGVYGVAVGSVFCAESKFHTETDCSKIALFHLIDHLRTNKFELLEVQFMNEHIKTLGASLIPAKQYHDTLENSLASPRSFMPTDS